MEVIQWLLNGKLIRSCIIILLLLNGVGALYGGSSLIRYPDGSGLGMTVDILKQSPFTNFLIPGIILLIINGIGSVVVLVTIIFNLRKQYFLVIGQGIVLCLWIIVQIMMIRQIIQLHYIMFAIGMLLIVLAYLLRKKRI